MASPSRRRETTLLIDPPRREAEAHKVARTIAARMGAEGLYGAGPRTRHGQLDEV